MTKKIEFPKNYLIISTDGTAQVQFTYDYDMVAMVTALTMIMTRYPETEQLIKMSLETLKKSRQ